MRTEVIRADTIEAAVERILKELKDTSRSRENAIYFDGWEGLGASAVLRAVAQRLLATTRPPGLEFEHIIHIDSSKWESRRAMQRKIAEQLKLPSRVMDMFDRQDEEDDFNGVDQASRAEVAQVAIEINQTIHDRKFLAILHNGSNEEIDIFNLGLSLYGYAGNKMVWTFRGRFRLDPKMRDKVTNTTAHVVLSASRYERDPQKLWSYLVLQEATELVVHNCKHDGITELVAVDDSAAATLVAECFSYMWERSYISQHIIDYGWALHASNYLVCDGIIHIQQQQQRRQQAQDDGVHEAAWQVGDALHRAMELPPRQQAARKEEEDDRDDLLHSRMEMSAERRPYWISKSTCGFVLSSAGVISTSMFQHSDRLGVLKLSRCTFRFSSPPFLCCNSLRFLWLDHCQDQDPLLTGRRADGDADAEKEDRNTKRSSWACFQSLWVLDLRYTDWDRILSAQMMDLMTQLRELNIMGAKNWDMNHLRGRLRNIRKLRVTKSTCCNYSSSFLSGMERMELLDFSGNHTTQGQGGVTCLSGAAVSSSLKTFIIDGCVGASIQKKDGCVGLQKITLQSCAELKNLLLRGLFRDLEELDLSGTTLQRIDLSAMQIPVLERLVLTGCEHLRAILWPPADKRRELDVLRIDTTSRSASADGTGEENLAAATTARLSSFSKWRISLTDARLLRSLLPVKGYFEGAYFHIDICAAATVGGSIVQPHTSTPMVDSKYRDVFKEAAVPVTMMTWGCPEIPLPSSSDERSCIIELITQQQGSNKLLEGTRKLLQGSSKLLEGSSELLEGSSELLEGSSELLESREGSSKLLEGTSKLLQGSRKLLESREGSSKLLEGTSKLVQGSSKLLESREGSSKLLQGSSKLLESREGSSKLLESREGSSKLLEGTSKLLQGSRKLLESREGSSKLLEGTSKLVQGSSKLLKGSSELLQGSSKLLEGREDSSKLLRGTSTSGLLLPDFVCDMATSLHVYDNSSITSVPAPPEGARWTYLGWCRVERCPKVHTVFATPQGSDVCIFYCLRIFWASQLPTARYVWNWPAMSQLDRDSFQELRFLHLDCCPRLIHVLPLPTGVDTLRSLETLEIVCCGDLREVFPSKPRYQFYGLPKTIEFPRLKRIHLHELPMLQSMAGYFMSAPSLETVIIRGCWSLNRLPAIGHTKRPPTVDCEKEWWDRLNWYGVNAEHYRPSHSPYYKTQLPKGSILR